MTDTPVPETIVCAAGAIPWRRTPDGIEVALVHRPRYGDWSWPKGKLEGGEDWPVTAVREVAEETGWRVRLGRPLPTARYVVGVDPKEVRYWAGEVVGGHGRLEHEIDTVAWLSPAAARDRLSYEHDRDQLDALLAHEEDGRLRTLPFLLVRHAKATPRRDWPHADWKRPLDARGFAQAEALPALLSAYDVEEFISSSSTRCLQTLEPAAAARGRKIERERALSEESFAKHPKRASAAFTAALRRRSVLALCTHGPLIPGLLRILADHARGERRDELASGADDGLAKGEVLVAHLRTGKGKPRVLDVERHPPTTS